MPAALCSVIEAEGRAKSASRSDWTGLVRPRMALSNPISVGRTNSPESHRRFDECDSRRTTQFCLEAGQLGEPLLEGGMGREEGGETHSALGDGRSEVE